MGSLFKQRMAALGSLAKSTRQRSYAVDQKTFRNTTGWRDAKLYDRNMNLLEEHVDINFIYSAKYTLSKDQVEWLIRFRPDFYPDKKYKEEDGIERFGYYLEFEDEKTGSRDKWLIFGKTEKDMFVYYNILKCNWTFRWVYKGVIYSCLGCIRDRNSYDSGVWSDGFISTVQDQAMFIVPTNDVTRTLDFEMRFMLSDNPIHPTTYGITKMTTVTPIGITKIVLKQDHFNKEKDNVELKICDYYDTVQSIPKEELPKRVSLSLSGSNSLLYINGNKRTIEAHCPEDENFKVSWTFELDGKELPDSDISKYFEVELSRHTIAVKAKKDYSLIGKRLRIYADFQFDELNTRRTYQDLEVVR